MSESVPRVRVALRSTFSTAEMSSEASDPAGSSKGSVVSRWGEEAMVVV